MMKDILVEWRKYLKEEETLQMDPKINAIREESDNLYSSFLEMGFASEELSHEDFISNISLLMEYLRPEVIESLQDIVQEQNIKTKKDFIKYLDSAEEFKVFKNIQSYLKEAKSKSCRCGTNPLCCAESAEDKMKVETIIKKLHDNTYVVLNHYIDIATKDLESGEEVSDFIKRACDLNVELGFMPKSEYNKCVLYLKRNPNKCPDYMNKDPSTGECLPFIDKETAEKFSNEATVGGMQFFARIKRTCDTALRYKLFPEEEYSKCFAFKTKYPKRCPSKMIMKNGECVIDIPWAAPSSVRN